MKRSVVARQGAILLVAGLAALEAVGVRVAHIPEEIPGWSGGGRLGDD